MHNQKNESTLKVDSLNVTRLDWALSTALNDLIDDDASHFKRKRNSEKLVQGLKDFDDLFNGYDSGICYIAETTKCTDTGADTEETDTRLSERVGGKVEVNSNLFSNEDQFESTVYVNINDSNDTLDFRSDRQDCGLNPVPESVVFFYLNLPKLRKLIQALINTKSKVYDCNMSNRGSITNNICLKVYFGPIKWLSKSHFKWKRFILNISFSYESDDRISGVVAEVEESKEIEIDDIKEVEPVKKVAHDLDLSEMFDLAEEIDQKQMELTHSDRGLGD